ncbi:sensor domain-containing diguanylate cyclase [Sulfurimonas marina]|uniref:diguanylate cyclase n=1 Tax=Sulfurimonas marina TaxID=2590551 RepID=A0A7M1AX39_9BACT|nr:diguanylate cyclase [Sulfurimonas marina]QOP42023.1 diguanylate cyclase [Sulfurimonas marina]
MSIFNNRKIYIFLASFISILMVASYYYFDFVNAKKYEMQEENYKHQATDMHSRVAQMIFEKQKATIAIALVLSQDQRLIDEIKNRRVHRNYYKALVKKLKQDTEYKNIWINIIDKNLNSVYRSWTNKRGDSVKNVRTDLAEVIKTKKVLYTISSGKFAVAIKAMVPIMESNRVIGVLELISHFNSIEKGLKKSQIDSVVMLNKEHTQKLQHPFTETFLEGYYIANFDVPKDKLAYLQQEGIENYFSTGYKIENGYIIVSYPLTGFKGDTLGYYIMFKKLTDISTDNEEFFIFKWVAVGFIIILILAGMVNLVLFYLLARQKSYIKNIIDSSTNIVIINDKEKIIDVNKTFFKYFSKESSIEEFKDRHGCICELFVHEDGYITRYIDGELWIDYILHNPDKPNKVKIIYDNQSYYFSVGVALVSEEKGYYSAIFSDVTNEEMYKKELETLTITDSLTNIGNRRYYKIKIEETITLAKRYKFPIAVIMIDIDHFKRVNDKHGHGVGDSVLVEYTKLISTMIREADIFCRMGGEEFLIIVPYADLQKGAKLAEKIRKKVADHKVVLPITMSFGVTEYIQGEDSEHLLSRADEALYEAKANGRNQVVTR